MRSKRTVDGIDVGSETVFAGAGMMRTVQGRLRTYVPGVQVAHSFHPDRWDPSGTRCLTPFSSHGFHMVSTPMCGVDDNGLIYRNM